MKCRSQPAAALVALALSTLGCGSTNRERPSVDERRDAAVRDAGAEPAEAPPLRRTAPLSLRDRERWRPALKWPALCENAFQTSHASDDGGLVFHELAPGLSVVEVLCAAGAYQPSHVFVRFDERGSSREATLLAFPVYESADGTSLERSRQTELWGEPSVSIPTRELSVLAMSRQSRDCGIWARYNVATEHPTLVAAAARLPCPARPGPPATSADGNAPRGWRPIRPAR